MRWFSLAPRSAPRISADYFFCHSHGSGGPVRATRGPCLSGRKLASTSTFSGRYSAGISGVADERVRQPPPLVEPDRTEFVIPRVFAPGPEAVVVDLDPDEHGPPPVFPG